ncbi:MAG: hypothetical protein K2L17_02765 [Muribaculaceae bacterium]|nr:hypothetical protein [Muribaculaceae bacterium]
MKRQTLVYGVLSLTAVASITSCVDDKYDLSDIDTTSRFTVDNLTVPVPLSEIKLENVINLDDNENIEKVIDKDGNEYYAIVKGGEIATSELSIDGIHVAQPSFSPSIFSVDLPVPGGIVLPGVAIDLPAIDLPHVDLQSYEFGMNNVDKALIKLKDVHTKNPIKIQVVLTVPSVLINAKSSIAFQNIKLQLPWGMISSNPNYDKETGMLIINELAVDQNGKATLDFEANGLDLGNKGTVVDGYLGISGMVGIDAAQIKISVADIEIPSSIDIKAEYSVSSFDISSFSGTINYEMDDIDIDPISLSGLPDFLDSPETDIVIANPQILVSINNPVGKYGLTGSGMIRLTSKFKNGESINYDSDEFFIAGDHTDLAFCTPKTGYTDVKFDGLRKVLSSDGVGLPEEVKVNIQNISFAGDVTDFPLGDNIGTADGSYEFSAPLGFGEGSKVVYETTEDGWGSDDLDDVNITKIHLKAICSTNLPVSVQLTVVPVDKNGNEIRVKENSGLFSVPAKANNVPVELLIESVNGPIKDFDGVKFRAVVNQDSADNVDALGPDLYINLGDVRVTVDGYYETEF